MTINIKDVKECCKPLFNILLANGNKKVSSLFRDHERELIKALVDGRQNKRNSIKNSKTGKILAIKCYYYGRWMLLVGANAVSFGRRESANTGYNYMCTEGARCWYKKNKEYKAGLLKLEGLKPKEFSKKKDSLLAIRASIDLKAPNTPKSYETYEEAIEALKELGLTGV